VRYPPVRAVAPPKPRHPRYLSLAERTTIADLRRVRKTVQQIAAEIGRSPSTVSRELRRNVDGSGRYLPHTADRLAAERLPRPRKRRLMGDVELRDVITDLLGKRWSPEQVAHELPSCSPPSRTDTCARSRSTRPSTTPTRPSPDRPSAAVGAVGAGPKAWSGAGT
jgi:transposase, IS30 family